LSDPYVLEGVNWIMRQEAICQEVKRLKVKYHTEDPYEICRMMKIRIVLWSMGTHEKSGKGACIIDSRCTTILLNSDLPEHILLIILTHELGHAVLHRAVPGIKAFHDLSLNYADKDELERDANVFAAEFLLDSECVMDSIREDDDFFYSACRLHVPPELLDYKLRLMQNQGYPVNAPQIARADFLKRDINRPYQV